jgi:hypothetical protein
MWFAVDYRLWYSSTTEKVIMTVKSFKHSKLKVFCIKYKGSEHLRLAGPAWGVTEHRGCTGNQYSRGVRTSFSVPSADIILICVEHAVHN